MGVGPVGDRRRGRRIPQSEDKGNRNLIRASGGKQSLRRTKERKQKWRSKRKINHGGAYEPAQGKAGKYPRQVEEFKAPVSCPGKIGGGGRKLPTRVGP